MIPSQLLTLLTDNESRKSHLPWFSLEDVFVAKGKQLTVSILSAESFRCFQVDVNVDYMKLNRAVNHKRQKDTLMSTRLYNQKQK